ncbi:MAG TPA: DUF2171 domain-containing protein [Allosphingosinicella sp.]
MATLGSVRSGLQVLGSDGGMIGIVDAIEASRIRLHSTAEPVGEYHIPSNWVDRVDEHVHLSVTAAVARERWESAGEAAPAAGTRPGTTGDRADGRRNIFAWILGAIFVLAILVFAVRSCGYAVDERTNTEQALPSTDSDATGKGVGNGQ